MKKILIWFIVQYQIWISPWFGNQCRFYPSCSNYTKQSLENRGVMSGLWRGAKRILRCHPFSPGGVDLP